MSAREWADGGAMRGIVMDRLGTWVGVPGKG